MRKVLKIAGIALLCLAAAVGAFAAYVGVTGIPKYAPGKLALKVPVTPERVARGKKFGTLLCANCHMDPTTGKLTGKKIDDMPHQFGVVYSRNITADPVKGIGSWTDGEIAYFLRTGVDRHGQYIPPWMPKFPLLSDDDLESIIAFLRSDDALVAAAPVDPPGKSRPTYFTKLLTHTVFKPMPLPKERLVAPPASDRVAYGRYLVGSNGCFTCHSASFTRMDELHPEKSAGFMGGGNEMPDLSGTIVHTANLTPDETTGIGKWSEEEFSRAVRTGVRPDRTVVRFPMVPWPELTTEDAGAMYAYLRTVPKIHNDVPRLPHKPAPATAADGKALYYVYGCPSCHGHDGVGIGDLRKAVEHYPTDKGLEEWIRHAPRIKPGTRMPEWDGVIREGDYPAIIEYVKELGKKAAATAS